MFFLNVTFWQRWWQGRQGTSRLAALSNSVRRVFADLDKDISCFRRKTGMVCVDRCGRCCETADVQTTELEMLPMAFELIRSRGVDAAYKRAEVADFSGQCVFYEPVPGEKGRGRCSRYLTRPLICRLFAFSANADKYGRPRLIACGVAKEQFMDLIEKAQDDVAAGRTQAPVMSVYSMKISALDPSLGSEFLPINMAFKKAVDRVGLHQRFGG